MEDERGGGEDDEEGNSRLNEAPGEIFQQQCSSEAKDIQTITKLGCSLPE